MNNLENILESIIFVSGDGISRDDILDKLQILEEDFDKAIAKLEEKYNGDSGINLITYRNKLQFSSNSEYADEVAEVLNPIRERKLTRATLEALSIIAYKQPVTRLDVENVRGVNSDYAIQNLIKHNMIEVVGRKDTIGKPLLFGTTDDFLKRFELKDLEELPDYEELLENIALINQPKHTLYNEFEVQEDEEEEKRLQELKQQAESQQRDLSEFEIPKESIPNFLKNERNLEHIASDLEGSFKRLHNIEDEPEEELVEGEEVEGAEGEELVKEVDESKLEEMLSEELDNPDLVEAEDKKQATGE